jgi:putative membrane protein
MRLRHAVVLVASLAVVVVACSPNPASAQPRTPEERGMPRDATRQVTSRLSAADRAFLLAAIERGKLEVELGRLAVDRAAHPRVKELGQRMAEDHGRAGQELAELALAKGLSVPPLEGRDTRLVQRLSALSGAAFDRAYMAHLREHAGDVQEFWRESQRGDDSAVRSWSAEQLPVLEAHHALIREIDHQLRAAARSTATP